MRRMFRHFCIHYRRTGRCKVPISWECFLSLSSLAPDRSASMNLRVLNRILYGKTRQAKRIIMYPLWISVVVAFRGNEAAICPFSAYTMCVVFVGCIILPASSSRREIDALAGREPTQTQSRANSRHIVTWLPEFRPWHVSMYMDFEAHIRRLPVCCGGLAVHRILWSIWYQIPN